jgi:copper(I)-binding protein
VSTLSVARSRSAHAALASVLVGTIPLMSACGAGQNAPTRLEYSVAEGVQANAGNVVLRDLLLTADVGDTLAGATSLALHGVIGNNSGTDDQLTKVTAADGTTAAAAFVTVTPSASPSPSPSASTTAAPTTTKIPVGSSLTIGGNGVQLEVTGLKSAVLPGSLVSLTFAFRQSGSVTVAVPVYALRSLAAPEPTISITYPAPDVPGEFNHEEYDNQAAASPSS